LSAREVGRGFYEEQLRKGEEMLRKWLGEDYAAKVAAMDQAHKEALVADLFNAGVRHVGAVSRLLGMSGYQVAPIVRRLKGEADAAEEERRRAEEERLRAAKQAADREASKALRAAREDARRPILVKEIEDAAWFHNLLHDVGKHVYHRLVKHVEWTEEHARDEGKAFEAIASFFDNLVEAGIEKAHVLEELKVENMALDAYLTFAVDLLERARDRLTEYVRFAELAARTVCPRCRAKLMAQLVAMQAAGGPGEAKA
jgi:hypothetical protein